MEIKETIIPRVPQEVVDKTLDHFATDSDPGSLESCALGSKSGIHTSFLRGICNDISDLEKFSEHIPRFTNVGHHRSLAAYHRLYGMDSSGAVRRSRFSPLPFTPYIYQFVMTIPHT